MTTLTEDQRSLLIEAGGAPDGAIAAPTDAKLFKPLSKLGYFIALPQTQGGSRLMITDAGRQAVGLPAEPGSPSCEAEAEAKPAPATASAKAPRPRKPKAEAPTGKLGVLVDLLKRPDGATLADLTAATGWRTHSVRGALAGSLKKGFGFAIESQKTEAGRVYRIATGTSA